MTLDPTADELLDMIERERLLLNVNDNSGEVMVCSCDTKWEGDSLRGTLTQAFQTFNKHQNEQPTN
jgi:hypothetical protein